MAITLGIAAQLLLGTAWADTHALRPPCPSLRLRSHVTAFRMMGSRRPATARPFVPRLAIPRPDELIGAKPLSRKGTSYLIESEDGSRRVLRFPGPDDDLRSAAFVSRVFGLIETPSVRAAEVRLVEGQAARELADKVSKLTGKAHDAPELVAIEELAPGKEAFAHLREGGTLDATQEQAVADYWMTCATLFVTDCFARNYFLSPDGVTAVDFAFPRSLLQQPFGPPPLEGQLHFHPTRFQGKSNEDYVATLPEMREIFRKTSPGRRKALAELDEKKLQEAAAAAGYPLGPRETRKILEQRDDILRIANRPPDP